MLVPGAVLARLFPRVGLSGSPIRPGLACALAAIYRESLP